MSLTSTITAVNTAVAAEVSGASSSIGARVADDLGAPPRLRWTPISDDATPAPKQSATGDGLSRAIVGIDATFDVECCGADYESTLTLRDALVRALRSVVGPAAHALGAGRWANGDALTQGEAVTHRVTLRAFVSETAPTVATVTAVAFDTTGATDGDGIILVPSDT